jgi:hypothetical protein
MEFTHEQPCSCGGRYVFSAYGDASFGQATCTNCGQHGQLIDPLSVSVTAERLLYRSKAELEKGNYSLSIVIGVMAIESYLTRLFLKFKGMDSDASSFNLPTPEQEAEWEKEYPRSGGFSAPAGFVSQKLVERSFDEFVAGNGTASAIFRALPNSSGISPTQYFQDELFKRRNRIVHWGYVNSNETDAELCQTIAIALVSIFRELNRSKYANP